MHQSQRTRPATEVEPDMPSVEASPVDCPDCEGSGVRVDKRLQGQPAVEVTAAA